jgi:hypothetical protein
MSVNECLTTVVGLSANDCPCFEADRPDDYNTSLSGYYLDDPEYGFPLKIPQSIRDCEGNPMWDILERAREAGITQFLTDFGANILASKYKQKMEPFNDWVGRKSWNMNLAAPNLSTFVGWKINPHVFKGTIGKVYKLELAITGRDGDTIEIGFYDEAGLLSGIPVAAVDMDIDNGKGVVTLEEAYIHDFMDSYGGKNKMWILYEPGSGFPKNNTIKCVTCPGKRDPWYDYMSIQGVKGSTTEAIYDIDTYQSWAFGLRIAMSMSCGNSWLCQQWDYDNDNWARVKAESITLYGIKKLAGIILNDPNPNMFTMLSREEIGLHRNRIDKLLSERMPWLSDNIPMDSTDCFTCNKRLTVRSQMV